MWYRKRVWLWLIVSAINLLTLRMMYDLGLWLKTIAWAGMAGPPEASFLMVFVGRAALLRSRLVPTIGILILVALAAACLRYTIFWVGLRIPWVQPAGKWLAPHLPYGANVLGQWRYFSPDTPALDVGWPRVAALGLEWHGPRPTPEYSDERERGRWDQRTEQGGNMVEMAVASTYQWS